ncbi:hypothetical protein ANO11243_032830 [Dothideomycetidae sp. 11243]|nr:hypothetical protein ANO11243_032830 [fungal sp. No.11243]
MRRRDSKPPFTRCSVTEPYKPLQGNCKAPGDLGLVLDYYRCKPEARSRNMPASEMREAGSDKMERKKNSGRRQQARFILPRPPRCQSSTQRRSFVRGTAFFLHILPHSLRFDFHVSSIAMKVTIPSLAILAAAGTATASAVPKHAVTAKPYTIDNIVAAQSSVLSAMSAKKPKPTHAESKPASAVLPHSSSAAKTASSTKASPAHATTPAAVESAPHVSTLATSAKGTTTKAAATTAATHVATTTTHAKLDRRAAASSIPGVITNIPIPSQACATVPNYGVTYVPTVSTPAGFLNDTTIYQTALNAGTPSGYVWNWAGLYTAVISSSYIGYAQLTSYNASACAAYCNSVSNCQGFDMYYERDPTVWPGASCPNPTMQSSIHCALYSSAVTVASASNVGQWNGNFQVLVAGANGYSKVGAK